MTTKSIQQKLSQMRGQLTRWIMVYGLGRWLAAALLLLAADMALDRLFRMDFAQRVVLLLVMAAGIGVYFFWRVIRPLFSRATDKALLYEVEQKHPELQEAVLSSYELANEKSASRTGEMSLQLAEATIRHGNEKAAGLNFGDALDLGQSRWNLMLLAGGLVVASLLGIGVTSNSFLKTWFNRNVMLGDDQWPQGTYLEIMGVVDGKLTVSRGADHRQFVIVQERSPNQNVSVSLEVDNPSGRSVLPLKPTGKLDGREHLFTFHNVSSKFRFRAKGGDDTTDWVDVELVEPPNVSDMKLTTVLPDYTGVENEQLVGSGPHSVLRGSKMIVNIGANKSLTSASLNYETESFVMKQSENDQRFELQLPVGKELRGGEYVFGLVDKGGIAGVRKSKFKISITEDKAPKVRASLLGISGEVVPRAMIPMSFQAIDEHGLRVLAFECSWKDGDAEDSPVRTKVITFAEFEKEGLLKDRTNRVSEVSVLDLIPLKLKPGISLKLKLAATDFYPETENTGWSQEFLLRIVTEAALRSSLLRREIEQREAFDQAYQKQLALTTELEAILVRQRPDDVTAVDFVADQESKLIAAVREQKTIGTAAAAVADRFEEFLVEIKNNRLDEAENALTPDQPEQRIEVRFDQKIVQPIRQLDAELISMAARHMDNCRVNAGNPGELTAAVAKAGVVHQEILLEMKNILDAMSSSENFQGLVNDVLEIKRDTDAIRNGIKDEKPDDGGIFDDDKIFDQ